MTTTFTSIASPLGELLLTGTEEGLTALLFQQPPAETLAGWRRADRAFADARGQLAEYFAGRRTAFELAVAPTGTEFQRRVWEQLARIPFGQTITYTELADRIGRPGAVRAVGLANARNPLPLVVPCHRVVGSSGSLTGYGGGLERKAWLLVHERTVAAQAGRDSGQSPRRRAAASSRRQSPRPGA